VTAEGLLD